MNKAFPLVVLALLLVPTALAHVDAPRYSIQPSEGRRGVVPTLTGMNLTYDLLLVRDPVEHLVRYTIDPPRGFVQGEFRIAASSTENAFVHRWHLDRYIEYKDSNKDGKYDPSVDTVVRSWPFEQFRWNATPIQRVVVGEATGQDVVWQGVHPSGPTLRFEAVATGAAFTDEGARVREQDVILYIDLENLPIRNLGNQHALEGRFVPPPGATVKADKAGNLTRALDIELPNRLGLMDWGGQAVLDGQERQVDFSWTDPGADGAQTWRVHFPVTEEDIHMIIVMGTEYIIPNKRAPAPAWPLVLLVLVGAAVALRRGR